MNIGKRELELSVESSPKIQTQTYIRLSLVISTWVSITLLKLTDDLLISPFHCILSTAARATLSESQPITPEMNIIIYVNYTSKKSHLVTPCSKSIAGLSRNPQGNSHSRPLPFTDGRVPVTLKQKCPWPRLLKCGGKMGYHLMQRNIGLK